MKQRGVVNLGGILVLPRPATDVPGSLLHVLPWAHRGSGICISSVEIIVVVVVFGRGVAYRVYLR